MSQQTTKNSNQNRNKRFASNNHQFKKRTPPKPFQRDNDIYVTNKSDFKVRILNTILNC